MADSAPCRCASALRNVSTVSACTAVTKASASASTPGRVPRLGQAARLRPAPGAAARARRSNRAGSRSARMRQWSLPSVSISATSTPSSEVPLISPIALIAPTRITLLCALSIRRRTCYTTGATTQTSRGPAMSAYKSEFLNTLGRARLHPSGLGAGGARRAGQSRRRSPAYIGFDCTAASLHVGSLLPIMMLYWMQQTGHQPIALMGGGTTRVGDPSGKDESRRILTDAQIDENLKGIRAVFSKFLKFESDGGTRGHGQQCRLAQFAQLHRLPARRRPPLLGQPHARVRTR